MLVYREDFSIVILKDHSFFFYPLFEQHEGCPNTYISFLLAACLGKMIFHYAALAKLTLPGPQPADPRRM